MALITVLDAHLAFGDRPLLDGAQLTVQPGERIGLIGRNGTGKSTLLRVIAGSIQLDDGELQRRDGLRIAFVEQEPELPPARTLRESLLERLRGSLRGGARNERRDSWRLESRLNEFLQRFDLVRDQSPANSSGGERKRAALALALALQPELLLLDEPTNHLDIDGIERLEELLLKVPASIVITHDRAFLDRVAPRIVELDRGVLRSYPGNFAAYEERKDRGAGGRGDRAPALRQVLAAGGSLDPQRRRGTAHAQRRARARLERSARGARRAPRTHRQRAAAPRCRRALGPARRGARPGDKALRTSARWSTRLSLRVMRGDRIGLIGANGAGKSTLIRIILGELPPDSGTVRLGTQSAGRLLRPAARAAGSRGHRRRDHQPGLRLGRDRRRSAGTSSAISGTSCLPSQRAKSPVKMLSGGERNRLLLARLFARPANLVVLDEPTNDLDIESLELLEQKLQEYTGTLLLVSHDRRFLDNVVTQTLSAEGDGVWRENVGGYSDWLQKRPPARAAAPRATEARRAKELAAEAMAKAKADRPRTKLSYKEQRELAALPGEIEALEQEQTELTTRMGSSDYHRLDPQRLREDRRRLQELESLLSVKFARWETLEQLASGFT